MSNYRSQVADPREVRDAWCAGRRVGDHAATFYDGEQFRCPGTKLLSGGGRVVCGAALPGFAKPHTRVLIRVRSGLGLPGPSVGTNAACPNCKSALELFAVLEATG